jgi:hypothetical protein
MKVCQECGMTSARPFLGTPVCMRDSPDRYSDLRKIELAKRGCFQFKLNDD